ncbi:Hsp20/alpha crystallin family protein [Rufibacter sediminis]|uniref:Hsp20/alpha crystallin family protein n=1 Tax=Rufibacter sediminis TaxID=2762756 RepID=A0ABR6VYI7_9BACT|nr:Hsp20/alpha crystallin family protein [Rufibacter sediminis]MBC3541974.1 Hsp20/alpha crystallin family protein [Rufibacter sediminis]
MTTVKQQPVLQGRAPQTFSSLLDTFFQDTVNNRRVQGFTPAVDLWETEKSYEVELALPGLKKENINVEFEEGVLRISGERPFNKENQGQKFLRVENLYGKFRRAFQLPDHVDATAIEAQFENGILRISVPKVEEKVVKHQISVK